MLYKITAIFFLFFALSLTSHAQIIKVPQEVIAAFSKQYKAAEDVSYKDNLKSFGVHFTMAGEPMIARYSSKGQWIETEKVIDFAVVPQSVKEGLEKKQVLGLGKYRGRRNTASIGYGAVSPESRKKRDSKEIPVLQ